jgi:hypothetical protein
LDLNTNPDGLLCTVNANYINYVLNSTDINSLNKNITFDVTRIDEILNFYGTHLKVNGHLGYLCGAHKGIIDISLVDRCWTTGSAIVNTTFNGNFDYTSDSQGSKLVSASAGNNTLNYRLQKGNRAGGTFQYEFVEGWMFSNAGSTMNLLGNWDIQDFWFSHAAGRLNIPSGTVINIGPKRQNNLGNNLNGFIKGETFGISGVDVNIGGTIVERCDISGPCNTSQSAHTYSNTIMFVDDWSKTSNQSTRVVYNGATIIVRDQNSQILTTPTSGGTVGIYSGGLNTNKMDSFAAEKEKIRVLVSGGTASYTVLSSGGTANFSAHTFTTTTGSTAAQCALELTSLTNASSSAKVTASQDTVGVDEYFYLESDVDGNALTVTFNTKTALGTVIRHNTKSIIDAVGGMLIEDTNIIKDLFN